ncbi:hypothetical protein [Ensifer canadensis]|uniref:hypothetical protein n=1 Tax=Ensifer canadensis TaxID=555315 RepID=UPI0035E3C30A
MKFRTCCRSRLPGFDIGKKYSAVVADQNWELALLATRSDITQYTIWHKTNTVPLLRYDSVLGMLRIDVSALGCYVERLQRLYFFTGRSSEWFGVLDRLISNIEHPSWRRKIAYLRALFHLQPGYSRNDARRELRKAGRIAPDETDIELLQIFIDLEYFRMSFAERMTYLDRILSISKDLSDQLQYRGCKAIQYFLIGDQAAAEKLMAEMVELGRNADNQPLSRYENTLFAHGVQHLGMLRMSPDLLEESIDLLNGLLLDDDLTPVGRAALHREIGESNKFLERWADAEIALRAGLQLTNEPVDHIHLAEAMLYQKKIEGACAEIDRVKPDDLTDPVREDHILAYASIAIWSEDLERLSQAKVMLEGLEPAEPYFRERKLKLLLSVTTALSKGTVSAQQKAESVPKGGVLSLLSKIFMIQPNVAGIGINFNAILEELAKRRAPANSSHDQHRQTDS